MKLFLCLIFFVISLGFADENGLASVKVVDHDHFSKMMKDLNSLRGQGGSNNKAFQDLLDRASKVSQMYDRCASINLSDAIDTSCVHFFNIDFPAFEKKYFEMTGEMRISSVKVTNDLV